MFLLTGFVVTVVLLFTDINVSAHLLSSGSDSDASSAKTSNNLLSASKHNPSNVLRVRTIRRALESNFDERGGKFLDDGRLKLSRRAGGLDGAVISRGDGDRRSWVESVALFFAGFVCVSSIVLSMCAICDTCREKKKEKNKEYQNGYIGRIDLADIKVIYNPAADGAFRLPIYAYSSGGLPGTGVSVGVKAGGLNNKGFAESNESLVLSNAAVLTSPSANGNRITASNYTVINNTRTQKPPAAVHVGHLENSTVPRTAKGSNLTRLDAHTDGTATYNLTDHRNNKNNRANMSATGGKLKDVQVDRGNRIVLTYENGSAINGDAYWQNRTDVTNATQINRYGTSDKRTGTRAGDGRRKGSRGIESVADGGGTGLNYDMNDVAIKNMHARY